MANDTGTDRTTQKNTPDFDIFHPRDKGPWQKLGIGYNNRDGSVTLLVEYMPVGSPDGRLRLQLRPHEVKDAEGRDAPAEAPSKPSTPSKTSSAPSRL